MTRVGALHPVFSVLMVALLSFLQTVFIQGALNAYLYKKYYNRSFNKDQAYLQEDQVLVNSAF